MRTLLLALLLCLFLSGKGQCIQDRENLLSLEQDFYQIGNYIGTTHKAIQLTLIEGDSLSVLIGNTYWKLSFVREVVNDDEEESMRQYSSQDSKGLQVTFKLFYDGTKITDIAIMERLISCHFSITHSYQL